MKAILWFALAVIVGPVLFVLTGRGHYDKSAAVAYDGKPVIPPEKAASLWGGWKSAQALATAANAVVLPSQDPHYLQAILRPGAPGRADPAAAQTLARSLHQQIGPGGRISLYDEAGRVLAELPVP